MAVSSTHEGCQLVQEELTRTILQERQSNYELLRKIERVRLEGIAHQNQRFEKMREALASVTWSDSLEEAHKIASEALREIDHD